MGTHLLLHFLNGLSKLPILSAQCDDLVRRLSTINTAKDQRARFSVEARDSQS